MELTDQKTIVKRIAGQWVGKSEAHKEYPYSATLSASMLSYRYALEMCGLTLNEIISLGDADNLDEAIDDLFAKNSVKTQ